MHNLSGLNRRAFLTTAGLATLAASGSTRSAEPSAAEPAKAPIRLGISSYSYWHFTPQKVTIEQVIDRAAALNVPGVDILHRQMDVDEFAKLDEPLHATCN